jgi:hypothetical protein
MSRQSEAKARMGYDPKPLARSCRNCESIVRVWSCPDPIRYPNYKTEKITCGHKLAILICNGFAVKAQAVCKEFKAKD